MGQNRSIVKTFITLYILAAALTVSLFAQESRINEELASPMTEIPLKQAMGKEAYDDAIGSGRYRYIGNSKCRLCHRKFFIGRKRDAHDYAMEKLAKSGHEESPRCLICHSTGYGTDTGFVSMKSTPRLANVQCEGCHGPGNEHVRLIKAKKKGGFLAGVDHPERLKNICKSCHTQRWDKSYHDLQKAYDSYKSADPKR
ncbi:MAG: cytochrome c family protein [Campylobacterota bacterium]